MRERRQPRRGIDFCEASGTRCTAVEWGVGSAEAKEGLLELETYRNNEERETESDEKAKVAKRRKLAKATIRVFHSNHSLLVSVGRQLHEAENARS